MQKWPEETSMVRHGESKYNAFDRESVPGYEAFVEQYEREFKQLNPTTLAQGKFPSPKLLQLAIEFQTNADRMSAIAIQTSDYDTPLTKEGHDQSEATGERLPGLIQLPDAIYVSPYLRTRQTFDGLKRGWPDLADVPVKFDERIREQEHGLRIDYADPRVYSVFNPQYALLFKLSTEYEYRHEGGESLLDVRQRIRGFIATLIREHGGLPETLKDYVVDLVRSKSAATHRLIQALGVEPDTKPENVMLVTHHLTILAMRANLEGWDRDRFLKENKPENRPKNASVTIYRSMPTDLDRSRQGQKGRLQLTENGVTLY